MNNSEKILRSRERAKNNIARSLSYKAEEEGGCGVTGFITSVPVSGRNIFAPSFQMRNRGNGKGGGISALGFTPKQLGVSQKVLDENYMLHIALIETGIREELEKKFIKPFFAVEKSKKLNTIGDYRSIGLEVKPPDVVRFFIRVKENMLDEFIEKNSIGSLSRQDAEEEFIHRISYQLNSEYYASLGDKKAFVLSAGKNIMILKVVGYAEKVVEYYKLEDMKAHVWIAHQRYPTRGRVWHPGGCHPFGAMNVALVHNGDFANYISVSRYLEQKNYHPLFLTDTEEAVLLLDLWGRVYKYPLEYLIEAMAPTSETDFNRLSEEKKKIYKAIQTHHVNSSPDGPWFFIIARNDLENNRLQLIGVTDTSMLRPQVFALQEGEVQVGLICSEKQAIDATLSSLSKEDKRFRPIADKYWNARGGSYTDGGAFVFNLSNENGNTRLDCTDKFGNKIETPKDKIVYDLSTNIKLENNTLKKEIENDLEKLFLLEYPEAVQKIYGYITNHISVFDSESMRFCIDTIKDYSLKNDNFRTTAIDTLTLLNDRRYKTGNIKRSSVLHLIKTNLDDIFSGVPEIEKKSDSRFCYIDFNTRDKIRTPEKNENTLVINALKFESQGSNCDAVLIKNAFNLGWKRFIVFNCRGQRFLGCGIGPESQGVRIDVYGSSGDYLGSGIDGMEIYVHGNAQDQLGQIMKSGKLAVFGDVGQTFMYGAKGGAVYVMGKAAGRPLINAVGRPRVVINGNVLDYLAESFMAGDPLNNGGFVVLNGIGFDDNGKIIEYESPYPGSNLFSLASGGAIYIRDPHKKVTEEQLNGGAFKDLDIEDWNLIYPYMQENENLFDIKIDDLLTVDGVKREPRDVFRKVAPVKLAVLTKDLDGLGD